jgi:hypothetical protein
MGRLRDELQLVPTGRLERMGIMKKAGAFAVAKKVYDEARKPHNQAKIKSAVAKVQERRQRPR